MRRVLIIDDEELMRMLIREAFDPKEFAVDEAANGKEGLRVFAENEYDLVILDVMMPVMDGWSVCRRIREKSDVLIIMLTVRDEDDDQLLGYELGVDDYVTKPVNIKVLKARSLRLLKRVNHKKEESMSDTIRDILEKQGICIERDAHIVKVNGVMRNFAPKEYDLLVYMMENEGRVLTREQILDRIWGYDYFGDDRVVDTHIKKIRKKLGNQADMIHTVIRMGYKFDSTH